MKSSDELGPLSQHNEPLAFSCKRRGICPSCGGRRMGDIAANWVDRVLPDLPMRQWVLSLPYRLRYLLAFDPRAVSIVLGAFLKTLFAWQRRRAKLLGFPGGQGGAVTAVQRFGSALNLNPHFHSLAFDGVFVEQDGPGSPPLFVPLPPPTDTQVAQIVTWEVACTSWTSGLRRGSKIARFEVGHRDEARISHTYDSNGLVIVEHND